MTRKAAADPTVKGMGMGRVPYWFRQRALVSKTVETLRPGGHLLTGRAVDVCGFGPGDAVLDAGCGYGITISYLARAHRLKSTGMEPDSRAAVRAARRPGGKRRLVLGNLPDIPFAAGTFKGVFCECVLSLVQDPDACLREISRVLAPNGYLVLADLYLRKWMPGYRRPERPGTCAQGAAPLMQMMAWVEGAGLDLHIMEDHSALLNQLGGMQPVPAAGKAATGYILIIAQKGRSPSPGARPKQP